MDAKNKALVTGASRGIGRAISLELSRRGSLVVVNYLPDGNGANYEDALGLRKEIEAEGGQCVLTGADVSREADVKQMAEEIDSVGGRLEILVNNAGILMDRTLKKMQRHEWDRVMEVNIGGVYNCCRELAVRMTGQNYGRVINISSVVAFSGNFGQTNYSASKSAVVGFTKSLARELARGGVTVNAVAPGIIDTDMMRSVPDKHREELVRRIPLGKMGSAEDVANAVAFLAARESGYITGQVIHVNGGFYM